MARAMSASLASARMKSLQPDGSAWMRANLASRDLCMVAITVFVLRPAGGAGIGLAMRLTSHGGPGDMHVADMHVMARNETHPTRRRPRGRFRRRQSGGSLTGPRRA